MAQCVHEQIRTLPAIEAEAHLFEVSRKMLGANPVPRSHDAALEKRECGLDCIGVNVSHDVHTRTVSNLSVVCSLGFPHGCIVRGCIIGENDFHILRDILADILRERSAFGVSGMEEAEIAVALADAYHYFFVIHASDTAFTLVPSAHVSNVHLDLAIEHRFFGLRHSVADAMAEIPRRLVAHSDRALNLAGRHSFLCFTEKMCGEKPLSECEVRIVEYGAGRDGELVVAVFAVEELLFGIQLDHWPFATEALWAFREAETNQEFTALIFGAKQSVYVN